MVQIYDFNTPSFDQNGRIMNESINCFVEENLNGMYECSIEYPINNSGKWQELIEGNILKVDGQLFRIYYKQKNLKSITATAKHIFYDLADNLIEDLNIENLTGLAAMNQMLGSTQYPHNFIVSGTMGSEVSKHFIRKNVVESILGDDGLIATIGGEIERNNFNIKYNQNRGIDRDVTVRYGKNIIGIEESINLDNICTRMLPLGKDGLMIENKYIDSQYINNYPHPKIKLFNFDDCEDESSLLTKATNFMEDNKIDEPKVNYKIDFLELSKTEEYKTYEILERVYLGDTITIKHEKLNIDLKCKIIKMKKNILLNRIESLELANFKANFYEAINEIKNQVNEVEKVQNENKTKLQNAIEEATELLTTALGGFVLKRENEILIMDTEDPATAQKVWCWNINGLGYSNTGIEGPYSTAITMSGEIIGSFIRAGTVTADMLSSNIGNSMDLSQNGSIINLGSNINFQVGRIDSLTGDMSDVKSYMTFGQDGLTISKDESPFQITIDNDSMDFKDNGAVVAYINGQKMYIGSLEVLDSVVIGVHKLEKYNDFTTLVRWSGQEG